MITINNTQYNFPGKYHTLVIAGGVRTGKITLLKSILNQLLNQPRFKLRIIEDDSVDLKRMSITPERIPTIVVTFSRARLAGFEKHSPDPLLVLCERQDGDVEQFSVKVLNGR